MAYNYNLYLKEVLCLWKYRLLHEVNQQPTVLTWQNPWVPLFSLNTLGITRQH